jgi:hypothetical protein
MTSRAEQLFYNLQTRDKILTLIGQTEDVHFDCKAWPDSDNDAQKVLAKAACGLTNAEGGVIVIGMTAKSMSKDDPDVVQSAAPVTDTTAVKSRVLDLLGQMVEPGIENVRVTEVNDVAGAKSGFVIVYVPASDGPPRRSRKDWKFYQRIGSGTFPMEYFQIEDRFGRTPHPKLELYLEPSGIKTGIDARTPLREFTLGLTNAGRGVAKFPSIRFNRSCGLMVDMYGIDGNMGMGLTQRPHDGEWFPFRGGVDEVIYPGETRKITPLRQTGARLQHTNHPSTPPQQQMNKWRFVPIHFECEISCDGIPTLKTVRDFGEEFYTTQGAWY